MAKIIYMIVDEDRKVILLRTLNRAFAYSFASRNSVNRRLKVYFKKAD